MTKATILKKLKRLQVGELKNLNNALTVTGYITTWFYTWEELYNRQYKDRLQELLLKIREDFVNPEYPYAYYDPYEYLTLRSISERNLMDTLDNKIADYADIIYENQNDYDLKEVFTRWTQE